MPAEKKSPDPDKARQPRSIGSFLLFLFVLIVVLAYFGSDSMSKKDTLSQDQYLYHLLTGRIVSQEFRGSESGATQIEGKYDPAQRADRSVGFEASFADVRDREEEFRQLKAEKDEGGIAPEDLLAAIEGGWYRPVSARSILRRETIESQVLSKTSGRGADEQASPSYQDQPPSKRVDFSEQLFVQVAAPSANSYGGTQAFYLPDQARHVWLEVVFGDMDSILFDDVLDRFDTAGASITRFSFDVTEKAGSTFSSSSGLMTTVLLVYGPWILIFAIILIVLRQVRGQGGAGGVMSFGRSRAQLYTKENRTNITFDDVAGAEEAKDEVREIVEFLKNPGRFTRIGGRIPRGVLLVGPPGCGKTLLAKAIAGEAEVPFFSISGSDFVEMFVGVGASRVRDLFKQARDNSPCIIFLDEIDAVGRRRGSGMGGGHDEREQTLNAILVEMDGFGTDEGIIVIAATNRPDVLDPALLRPGRFDREVTIDLPDMVGRRAILDVHLKKVKHGEDVDVGVLARSTPGYSGADLAAIVNEAAIMAVLAKRDEIWLEDLEEARDKVRYGRQKRSRKLEEEDRKITAYHEAGHAVVAAVLEGVDHPHKVTIVPRGRALGATMVLPEKESYHMQRNRLLGQLCVLFGGRVAEQEFCGDISAGASDDIRRATELARAMVTELGMSQAIGPINYAERQGSDFLGTELFRGKAHSEEKAKEIDDEVHRIIGEAYARTEEVLRAHRDRVETLTAALLEFETINGDEVVRLIEGASIEELSRDREETRKDAPAAPEASPPARPAEEEPRAGDLPGEPGLSPA